MKITRTQIGQDRPYGDFYYKYKIETNETLDIEEVLKKINNIFGTYHAPIPTMQWLREDDGGDNHFREHYVFYKEPYGYFLKITCPSTH